jgi:hypothetical protein
VIIKLGNFWYFFWLILSVGAVLGLYFGLKRTKERTQKIVLFSLLAFGFLLHFLKVFIPPYSVNETVKLRESWFVNICGANIGLFPFLYLLKSKRVKDYMFYIGVISGAIALLYPVEPMEKVDKIGETLDTIRFYYHHWMVMGVPLLMVLLKHHTLSWKRVLWAPTGLLLLMPFIMLNQLLQSELGFIPLRDGDFLDVSYKNSSLIWGPDLPGIGSIFAPFCPKIFKTVPVGEFKGQEKYWPWLWMVFPIYVLITPIAFGISMIFDHKNFKADMKTYFGKIKGLFTKRKK